MEEEKMETMEDYSKELEDSLRTIKVGDLLTGTVISVTEAEAVVDLQYYAQGVIKAEDMSNDPAFSMMDDVKTGDTVQAVVLKVDDGKGNILLSKKEAAQILAWDVLNGYLEAKTELTVKVAAVVKAGVVAYVEGIRGFIPASQLSLSYVENLEEWVGRELAVRVITVDKSKKKLVLSAKVVAREKAAEERNHRIAMLSPGTILEGTVETLMPYGAFVALPDGLSGLVHVSQISQKRIRTPSEVLSVGDKVKVKVLNTRDNKISLTMKNLDADTKSDDTFNVRPEDYNSKEAVTTSLGDLLKNLNL